MVWDSVRMVPRGDGIRFRYGGLSGDPGSRMITTGGLLPLAASAGIDMTTNKVTTQAVIRDILKKFFMTGGLKIVSHTVVNPFSHFIPKD